MPNSITGEGEKPRPDFLVILGLLPPVTVDDVKQAYLEKAKTTHPDRGGNADEFVALQKAFEQATEYARFKASRMEWLSQWVGQYAEQEATIAEVQALGGSVEIAGNDLLGNSIGNDFATVLERLISMRLSGPRIDDAFLVSLASRRQTFASLQKLELIDTQVTSVGAQQLQYFGSLRHLDLTGTHVSLRTAQSLLGKLDQLETLVLHNSGIGWLDVTKLRLSHLRVSISS
jgi:hypothetical protein